VVAKGEALQAKPFDLAHKWTLRSASMPELVADASTLEELFLGLFRITSTLRFVRRMWHGQYRISRHTPINVLIAYQTLPFGLGKATGILGWEWAKPLVATAMAVASTIAFPSLGAPLREAATPPVPQHSGGLSSPGPSAVDIPLVQPLSCSIFGRS